MSCFNPTSKAPAHTRVIPKMYWGTLFRALCPKLYAKQTDRHTHNEDKQTHTHTHTHTNKRRFTLVRLHSGTRSNARNSLPFYLPSFYLINYHLEQDCALPFRHYVVHIFEIYFTYMSIFYEGYAHLQLKLTIFLSTKIPTL